MKADKNLLPAVSLAVAYLVIFISQFYILFPLHRVKDLPLWDEANYMSMGSSFLSTGSLGEISSTPMFGLFYALLIKLFGTINSIFAMQYICKIAVSMLLLHWCVKSLKSCLLATVLCLLWVISSPNIAESILVYHFALGIFILSLIFSDKNPILSILLLCICSLIRLEYIFPTILFALYTGYNIYNHGKDESLIPSISKIHWIFTIASILLLVYVLAHIDSWNPGTSRTWFAFNQHYALRQVEAGRFTISPFIDFNIVMGNDFPGATSLFEALEANPYQFLKHVAYNALTLPFKTLYLLRPYSLRFPYLFVYAIAPITAFAIFIYALFQSRQRFFSFIRDNVKREKRFVFLSLIAATALLPSLLVYSHIRYTFPIMPFVLFWLGFIANLTFKAIDAPQLKRYFLTFVVGSLLVSITFGEKPFRVGENKRSVLNQVQTLDALLPQKPTKVLGISASTFANYLGQDRIIPIEPLDTVGGGQMKEENKNLNSILALHQPNVVIVNPDWLESKNFETQSFNVLMTDKWLHTRVDDLHIFVLKN